MTRINQQRAAIDFDSVERFAAALTSTSWFAATGEPLSGAEIAEAHDYLAGLGLPGVTVTSAGDWTAAKRITRDPGWDTRWWQAE